MAKMNSINNATINFAVNPGGATDSFVQFAINGTDEWRVGGDATDDSYRISQGSALGTNDALNIDANGIVLVPLQALAINTIVSEGSVTGDGTDHSIGSVAATTSVVDQNADMTEGDGAGIPATWTAPVTGLYNLYFSGSWNGTDATTVTVFMVTSNRTYRLFNSPMVGQVAGFFGVANLLFITCSIIVDMDASDTAVFHYQANGGTKDSTLGNRRIGAYLLV